MILQKRLALSIAIAAAFAGGYGLHDQIVVGGAAQAAPLAAAPGVPAVDAPRAMVRLPDFSAIAAEQGPAVVNVSVSGTTKTALSGMPDIDENSPFFDFFRRFGTPGPRGGAGRLPTQGLGSGFIVGADGVILTNAHVVADADDVTVKLTDKREFKAKVVGIDKTSDVAVLRIDAHGLPTVKIGNPETARVGEWVMAIGSPFGFENSVTAGIISAKSRTLPDEGYVPFMQTDVAINPGNSGGPLINVNGEVIGINSQIYSRSGGYQGLSFAIPIDVAMNVERQLVTGGKVSRGRLGVTIQEVNQDLADSFGLDKPRGALVSSVDDDSPAAKAGLQAGDIVLKYNGKDVTRSAELPALVAATAPGSTATLQVWRKGGSKEFSLRVGEMTDTLAAAGEAAPNAPAGKLGLALRALTADEKASVAGGRGLVVEDVGTGPAARAGIQPGDVIVAANGQPVASVGQLRSQLDKAGKHLALLVQRGERRIFIPIQLG
jgi:serine protease Do